MKLAVLLLSLLAVGALADGDTEEYAAEPSYKREYANPAPSHHGHPICKPGTQEIAFNIVPFTFTPNGFIALANATCDEGLYQTGGTCATGVIDTTTDPDGRPTTTFIPHTALLGNQLSTGYPGSNAAQTRCAAGFTPFPFKSEEERQAPTPGVVAVAYCCKPFIADPEPDFDQARKAERLGSEASSTRRVIKGKLPPLF